MIDSVDPHDNAEDIDTVRLIVWMYWIHTHRSLQLGLYNGAIEFALLTESYTL